MLQNTPQQDRTLAAYHACRAEERATNVSIDRVELDGRWLATTSNRSAYGLQELEACMRAHLSQTRSPMTAAAYPRKSTKERT